MILNLIFPEMAKDSVTNKMFQGIDVLILYALLYGILPISDTTYVIGLCVIVLTAIYRMEKAAKIH